MHQIKSQVLFVYCYYLSQSSASTHLFFVMLGVSHQNRHLSLTRVHGFEDDFVYS